jgi:hypothetical protein
MGVPDANSTAVRNMYGVYVFPKIICICATNPSCLQPQQFYHYIYQGDNQVLAPLYRVPGSVLGCFLVDSLLFSTLECLYLDSDCLSTLIAYQNLNTGYIK